MREFAFKSIALSLALFFLLTSAKIAYCTGSLHLRPLAATQANPNAPITATARMPEEEYLEEVEALRETVLSLCGDLESVLPPEERERLVSAQEAWMDFLASCDKTLSSVLSGDALVFYDVAGKERITNVRRDIVLAAHRQRAADLARWLEGKPVKKSENTAEENWDEGAELHRLLDMGSRVIYVTEERDRPAEYNAQRAWRKFYDRQAQFLALIHCGKPEYLRGEKRLMALRRANEMVLQEQGLIFFKREREE